MSLKRAGAALAFVLCGMMAAPAAAQQFEAELGKLTLVFNNLVSSLRITTAQTAASGNQVATVAMKAAEANATALTQFSTRMGVSDAVSKYAEGRDQTQAACAPVALRQMAAAAGERNAALANVLSSADRDFLASNQDAAMVQATLNQRRSEYYCSQEEYDAGLCAMLAGVGYNTGAAAGDTNAAIWMSGAASGAEEVATGIDYLDRLAPMPTLRAKTGAGSAIERIIAQGHAAQQSMAREIIGGSIIGGLE